MIYAKKGIIWMLSLLLCFSMGCSKKEGKAVGRVTLPAATSEPSENGTVEQPEKCIVIDPGHQEKGNADGEPIGPGASETKAKVTGGTAGKFTGVPEYVLNLEVSLKLRDELQARGYRVEMTRETHNVNLSNRERAEIAAAAEADAFIRIHANGSDDPNASGAMTICMTPDSPYNSALYNESYLLSRLILDSLVEQTGCVREKIWETDTMTGINWSSVPVTIVEMGYMTNEKEDLLLQDSDYQRKIVVGIADGIDQYFAFESGDDSSQDAALQERIANFLADDSSKWDVYVESLNRRSAAHVQTNLGSDERMVSASLIKLFIMGAVYDGIEAGTIDHASVSSDLRSMITWSDNEAANRLTGVVGGMDAVNRFAAKIGCESTKLNRLMLVDNGLQNYVSAEDCARILRMIENGTCVSAAWSAEMLDLLKAQEVNDRLPSKLPSDVMIAHKTGNLPSLSCGDVGIVFAEKETYLICAICNNPSSDEEATRRIASLSKIVYDYYLEH